MPQGEMLKPSICLLEAEFRQERRRVGQWAETGRGNVGGRGGGERMHEAHNATSQSEHLATGIH